MSERLKENLKVALYIGSVLPPLVEGVVGFVKAVKDAVRRLRGEKTSIQEAFDAHVEKVKDEILSDAKLRLKNHLAEIGLTVGPDGSYRPVVKEDEKAPE